jgi:hypothetical protein
MISHFRTCLRYTRQTFNEKFYIKMTEALGSPLYQPFSDYFLKLNQFKLPLDATLSLNQKAFSFHYPHSQLLIRTIFAKDRSQTSAQSKPYLKNRYL